jgi:hypothetical protein
MAFQTPAELLIRSLASDARCPETISLQQRAREEESHNQRLKGAPSATRPRIPARRSRRVRSLQSPLWPNSASTRDKRESPGSFCHRGPYLQTQFELGSFWYGSPNVTQFEPGETCRVRTAYTRTS